MFQQFKVIYENGMFCPLEPVALKEQQKDLLSVNQQMEGNLAEIATHYFCEEGVDLPPHPNVPVRDVPDLN